MYQHFIQKSPFTTFPETSHTKNQHKISSSPAMSNSSLNPKSASESASSMVELEKALGEMELLDKQQCHEEEDTEKKMSSSPVPPCTATMSNASSQNPKSEASASAGSMDEQEKALGEQQGHEEDTEKNPKSEASESSESSYSKEELKKVFGELEQAFGHVKDDPEKLLCNAKKVLDMLLREEKGIASAPLATRRSLTIVFLLNMLGTASMSLKSYDESLKYFNWADRKLNEVLEDGGGSSISSLRLGVGGGSSSSSLHLDGGGGSSSSSLCLEGGGGSSSSSLHLEDGGGSISGSLVVDILIKQIHFGLYLTKKAMGKKEDAPRHMKRVLEIKEKTMEEGSVGLGEAYKELYQDYLKIFEFEEALPYCLKALDIYTRHMGEDSEEVALIRRDLGLIYADLKEYDLAIEHNQLATSVLECATDEGGIDLLMADVQKGFILTQTGRHEEAVRSLKILVSRADTIDAGSRVLLYTAMAMALCGLEKLGEARKYMDAARKILDKKDKMPTLLEASELWDLALLYRRIEDYKTAMYVLRKILKTPALPKDDLLLYYRGFHALILKTDREEEELPYMEEAVERLKKSFGPKHVEVGYGNWDLGLACLTLGKDHEGVKYLENSKEILDVSLGPRHINALKLSETLSKAYAVTGRFDLAIPCQEKVVEGLMAAGPSELENLVEAARLLRAMQSDMASGGTH